MTPTEIEGLVSARFWSLVVKAGPDECWAWIGSKLKKDGRGRFWTGTKNMVAPRMMWLLTHGELPSSEIFVCHSCDNPNCVNPAHLWLGTNRDNMKDAARKGRICTQSNSEHLKGERHHNSKMNDAMVRAIRTDHAAGLGTRALAKKYGMTRWPIRAVVTGKGWTHVE